MCYVYMYRLYSWYKYVCNSGRFRFYWTSPKGGGVRRFTHSRSFPLADYYNLFLVSAISPPQRLLAVGGVCPDRGDGALRTVNPPVPPDEVSNITGQFNFFDTVPGANLAERRILNNFNTFPLCLAFTVGDLDEPARDTLMYTATSPLLVAGRTIELTIGSNRVVFNRNITESLSRAQICLDGSNAILYLDCNQVQSFPFTVTDPITSIGVLGEARTLANSYSVSYINCIYIVCRGKAAKTFWHVSFFIFPKAL